LASALNVSFFAQTSDLGIQPMLETVEKFAIKYPGECPLLTALAVCLLSSVSLLFQQVVSSYAFYAPENRCGCMGFFDCFNLSKRCDACGAVDAGLK
jgi:hypothetical protein